MNTHVGLSVDPAIRRGLSLPHTAVHLAALALNAAGEQFWTKEHSDKDTLGRPNLDKAAVETSVIREGISTDSYRFGKSLRKKGFDRDKFLASLEEVGKQINATVSEWRKQESAVLVLPEIGSLDGLREWGCELDGRRAVIPCGGTHVRTLAEIEDIIVTLTRSDDGFTMVTVAS
ncbi:hypothetical protein [Brucella pituitosa]|uniref:hypothetical protein n=1 Tax=Brucella pituitosa TaxID=571256 RepID=UPI0012FD8EF4|nr:hypothetical protein [Brucella pituitosa]